MQQRPVPVFLALLLAAGLLVGCGDQTTTTDPDKETDGGDDGDVTAEACPVDPSWITSPSLPVTVGTLAAPQNLCDFYRFSWQSFLYLVSRVDEEGSEKRNFQDAAHYPVLMRKGDSCTSQPSTAHMMVSAGKAETADGDFTIPERINQAGHDNEVIYDQRGNAVFYDIRFSRATFCPDPPTSGNLPVGTVEIKTSWREISDEEKDTFFFMETEVKDVGPKTLGLVGFHLAQVTTNHPEMVWATFEHKSNAPDCVEPKEPITAQSFTSGDCAKCLTGTPPPDFDCTSCKWNEGVKGGTSLTGPPTEICRVFRDGTQDGDNQSADNKRFIDSTNRQLVGPKGLLNKPTVKAGMGIWGNYFLVGGLWLNQDAEPPPQTATLADQRGSIRLANTTMETAYQGDYTWAPGGGSSSVGPDSKNCFDCHNYAAGSTATSGLSHIVDDITTGTGAAGN